jgi:tRNA(Ile)-lysidine synthase
LVNDFSQKPLLVAVSGGVDSIVLLDKLYRSGRRDLIIAHVDHGIRKDSASDAQFVKNIAERLGLSFELTTLRLGSHASEDTARQARYDFLRKMAHKHRATIVTAHHADDVVETVAINLTRGTGWRGVAVLGAPDIMRPLTGLFKSEIIDYAQTHSLEWREDSTNQTDRYLRNRIRTRCQTLTKDEKLQLLALWATQKYNAEQIDLEVQMLVTDRRHFYIMTNDNVAIEVLRGFLLQHSVRLTTPQLRRALHAIKAARPKTRFALDEQKYLYFSSTTVHVEVDSDIIIG